MTFFTIRTPRRSSCTPSTKLQLIRTKLLEPELLNLAKRVYWSGPYDPANNEILADLDNKLLLYSIPVPPTRGFRVEETLITPHKLT